MLYRYTGTEPCRMGSSLVRNGDVREMTGPINKLWVKVEPKADPKPKKKVTKEGNDG